MPGAQLEQDMREKLNQNQKVRPRVAPGLGNILNNPYPGRHVFFERELLLPVGRPVDEVLDDGGDD